MIFEIAESKNPSKQNGKTQVLMNTNLAVNFIKKTKFFNDS